MSYVFNNASTSYFEDIEYRGKNLVTIKHILEALIERKQAQVDVIQALLDNNTAQINELSGSVSFMPMNRKGDTWEKILSLISAGTYKRSGTHVEESLVDGKKYKFRLELSATATGRNSGAVTIYASNNPSASGGQQIKSFSASELDEAGELLNEFEYTATANTSYIYMTIGSMAEGTSCALSIYREHAVEYPDFADDYSQIAKECEGKYDYENWIDKSEYLFNPHKYPNEEIKCLTKKAENDIIELKKQCEAQKIDTQKVTDFVTYLVYRAAIIKELNYYIREDVYVNDDIGTSENASSTSYTETQEQLLRDGMQAFETMKTPTYEVNTSVVNFEKALNCQYDWGKARLGDIIHIRHGAASDYEYVMRIISKVVVPDTEDFTLTLSNRDNYKVAAARVVERSQRGTRAMQALSVNSGTWSNAAASAVDTVVNDILAEGKAAISSADNTVNFGNTGITVEGMYEANKGDQLRITKNSIALLKDGNIATAITPSGIVAERLVGNVILGRQLSIQQPKFTKDGCTQYVNMWTDSAGLHIKNGGLQITKDSLSGDENGLQLTPEQGLLVTNAPATVDGKAYWGAQLTKTYLKLGKVRVTEAQDDVITKIEFTATNVDINSSGTAKFDGDIYARDLHLGVIDDMSVIDYINANGISTSNPSASDGDNAAIKGKFISCAGLRISSGGREFSVDSDATVNIRNGEIYMTDSQGNQLIITAATPFKVTNKKGRTTAMLEADTGNLSIVGKLATGFEEDARVEISQNGIESYNEDGENHGLWVNVGNNFFQGIHVYYHNRSIFEVTCDAVGGGTTMYINGRKLAASYGNGIELSSNNVIYETGIPTPEYSPIATRAYVGKLIKDALEPTDPDPGVID